MGRGYRDRPSEQNALRINSAEGVRLWGAFRLPRAPGKVQATTPLLVWSGWAWRGPVQTASRPKATPHPQDVNNVNGATALRFHGDADDDGQRRHRGELDCSDQ